MTKHLMKNLSSISQMLIPLLVCCSYAYSAPANNPLTDKTLVTTISSTESIAEPEAPNINETRWYQVELLIFKQRPLSTDIVEIWPKNITLSYPEDWDTLKTPEEYQELYQKRSAPNTPFILLDKKQFKFSAIEKKLLLNRNDILLHAAWRQSLTQNLDKNDTETNTAILIQGGGRYDDRYELEGSITLSLLRYLHIDTNLWLTRFVPVTSNTAAQVEPPATNTTTAVAPSWPTLPPFPLLVAKPTAAQTTQDPSINPADSPNNSLVAISKYQVDEIVTNKQSRRMRSYETHYIDHPKFGILLRFIPLDENSMQPIPQNN